MGNGQRIFQLRRQLQQLKKRKASGTPEAVFVSQLLINSWLSNDSRNGWFMALYDKLSQTEQQLLAGKTAIADALRMAGVTAVEPNPNAPDSYEIFQSYADKIKRLMISNAFILEFTIPDNATKYKRTVMLPVVNRTDINSILRNLALEIVASDTGYTPSSATTHSSAFDEPNTVVDTFGNRCSDGTVVQWTDSELDGILPDEEISAFLNLLDDAGVQTRRNTESLADTELPDYDFVVDWGDGSPTQEYKGYDTTPDTWYHTYDTPGTYDVSITGYCRRVVNSVNQSGRIMVDGVVQYDRDGVALRDQCMWAMSYFLKKVIAWGNTRFQDLHHAFSTCSALETIPTYDTTASFADVTTIYCMFAYDTALRELPFDSNTGRGLFSGAGKIVNITACFSTCTGLRGNLPEAIFDGCGSILEADNVFRGCAGLTGQVPRNMFAGWSQCPSMRGFFANLKISGEIPEDLFQDCAALETVEGMFFGTGVSGVVPGGLFRNCPNIRDCACMFEACSGITGVEAGLLSHSSRPLDAKRMFARTGIMEVPEGLIGGIQVKDGTVLNKMFYQCESLSAVPSTIVEEVSSCKDARDMFGSCVALVSPAPSAPSNGDWDDQNKIWKYYSMFAADSGMTGMENLPKELGGHGARLHPSLHVGQVMLADATVVEIDDLVYDDDNKPAALVFWSDGEHDYAEAFNQSGLALAVQAIYNRGIWAERPSEAWPDADLYAEPRGYENTLNFMSWSAYTADKASFPAFKGLEERQPSVPGAPWYLPNGAEMLSIFSNDGFFNAMRQKFNELGILGSLYPSSECYPTGFGYFVQHWTCHTDNLLLFNNTMMRLNTQNACWSASLQRPCVKIPAR